MTYTLNITLRTGIPALPAASALPPLATIQRPQTTRLSRNASTPPAASTRMMGPGMPAILSFARAST